MKIPKKTYILSSIFNFKFNKVIQLILCFLELQCGAVLDPKSNCLVTCGKPGHLLFYDPQTNQQLMNLDVMNKNFVSSPEDLSAIEVTHVAFVENKESSCRNSFENFNNVFDFLSISVL